MLDYGQVRGWGWGASFGGVPLTRMSRSGAVAAAFLMRHHALRLRDALKRLRAGRPGSVGFPFSPSRGGWIFGSGRSLTRLTLTYFCTFLPDNLAFPRESGQKISLLHFRS